MHGNGISFWNLEHIEKSTKCGVCRFSEEKGVEDMPTLKHPYEVTIGA